MAKFKGFRDAVEKRFNEISKYPLFRVNVSKDELWEKYLSSFPDGSNPIYLERTEHDCNCCKSFIRNIGNVVAIDENMKVHTVWDLQTVDIDETYHVVSEMMRMLIVSSPITSVFLASENRYGARYTKQLSKQGEITWDHFSCEIPNNLFKSSVDIGPEMNRKNTAQALFSRGLNEITDDALNTVLELISSNSIYRGSEFKQAVSSFKKLKDAYNELHESKREAFIWLKSSETNTGIKNTAIGTLLMNLSEGLDLESAVKAFEKIVAPENYKRTSSLITPSMVKSAMETIEKEGLEGSLQRRFAKITDVSINNVLFADKKVATKMVNPIEAALSSGVKKKTSGKTLSEVREIEIEKFISDVMPTIDSMEVLVDNNHSTNFVSITTAQHLNAPHLFKWDNDFAWSYAGNVTDSLMKDRVKAAGGKTEGKLRFSIQWNEEGLDSQNDLDAHCDIVYSTGRKDHIYFSNMRGNNGGELDVDIRVPGSKVAVENMIWTNNVVDGTYVFYVHNYSGMNRKGFRAEIEFGGQTYTFNQESSVQNDVIVASVRVKNGNVEIDPKMPFGVISQDIWGLKTNEFVPVMNIMLSPNFWDDQEIGNKHYFFILEGCKNPDEARGFYNEFLRNDLTQHRKAFEILGEKMKCEVVDEQLSGLGFSSTVRNEMIVRVKGNINRDFKLKF